MLTYSEMEPWRQNRVKFEWKHDNRENEFGCKMSLRNVSQTQISRNLVYPKPISVLSNHFEIVLSCCRALCKMKAIWQLKWIFYEEDFARFVYKMSFSERGYPILEQLPESLITTWNGISIQIRPRENLGFLYGFRRLGEIAVLTLQWRHKWQRDFVSNHHCLLNRLFRRKSKKTSRLRVTGLCVGNSPVTGEFPTQRASNAENVSIWWRHHGDWCIPSTRRNDLFPTFTIATLYVTSRINWPFENCRQIGQT